MSSYIHFLLSVCLTMLTGVVIIGPLGAMVFLALLFWKMLRDELNL